MNPAPPTTRLVSVAICTRNRSAFLRKAVESVLPQLAGDAELIVVDNASTDDTAAMARAAAGTHPQVRLLSEPKPGLSAARNAALSAAAGRYVIFLDDDAIAQPGWLEAYRTFFSAASERVGVAGGGVIPEFEAAPPRWLGGGAERSAFDLGDRPCVIHEHRGPWGCNIAYRREAALRVGGFNPRLGRNGAFLGAHEELDLNLRLEEAGLEIWWVPNAPVRHFVGAERMRLKWQWKSEFAQSRCRVILKFRSRQRFSQRLAYGAGRVAIAPFHCAFNLLLAAVALPFNHRRTAAAAFLRTARSAGVARELLGIALGSNRSLS